MSHPADSTPVEQQVPARRPVLGKIEIGIRQGQQGRARFPQPATAGGADGEVGTDAAITDAPEPESASGPSNEKTP